jgi:hypothetical protein
VEMIDYMVAFCVSTVVFIYLDVHADTVMNRRIGKITTINTPDTIKTTKTNIIKTADT